ncbi:MAG: bifunctional folylpolyglutamate synthase/dihydrofolate synthase [Erysipelotrichia bacterium]|nr:bifunctional folylpolyglutamate synthase/dihydrofolate synthase [Erysipelotrichia bacterium]
MKTFEALNWLHERGVRTGPYSLDRINHILEELNNPHHDYASVLIGGTNGKGSVTAITESIMACCPDYLSGSLTSPHLVDIRERIKIMGKPLADKFWADGVTQLQEVFKLMEKESSIGPASFFEAVTALAFWAFKEAEIDLAILEVGLGGRFDATNSSSPEISVITNIGTDHQEYLGEGKLSIAREKLGIIRKNRPLITGEKSPEILEIFAEECKKRNSPLIIARPGQNFELLESRPDGHLIKTAFAPEPLFVALPGDHQLENLAIALELVMQLRKNGFAVPDEAISQGITAVRWAGRLQWIPGTPAILLDGAHNAEGLETLVTYLQKFPPAPPLNIIFGGLKGKPLPEMASRLSQFGAKLCFVPPQASRSLSKQEFDATFADQKWQWFDSFAEALEFCRNDASTILITGSLYLISDALKHLNKNVRTRN